MIELHGHITEDDYLTAQSLHMRPRLKFKILGIWLIIVFLGGFYVTLRSAIIEGKILWVFLYSALCFIISHLCVSMVYAASS